MTYLTQLSINNTNLICPLLERDFVRIELGGDVARFDPESSISIKPLDCTKGEFKTADEIGAPCSR